MAHTLNLIKHLKKKLLHPEKTQHFLLAYSGGRDSHVLLHSLMHLVNTHPENLHVRAIHADHGLQALSGDWAKHCQNTCKQLNITIDIIQLNLTINKGESLEAVAREARYQAFKQALQTDEILLTAHHQEDQAETLLLQLMRGAGVSGLAAMPEHANFGNNRLQRPLLDVPHTDIKQYAEQHQLSYIDDPSNDEQRFDRNYLRHEIMPRLKQRWPAATQNLYRSSQLQAEARELLESYVEVDYQTCLNAAKNSLKLTALASYSIPKQKAIVRHWLQKTKLPLPSATVLQQIFTTIIHAKPDANPSIQWQTYQIRRYRQQLYLVHDQQQASDISYQWNGENDFYCSTLGITVKAIDFVAIKSLLQATQKMLTIRFRKDGEKVYIAKRNQRLSLKNLMQELGVPPWERNRVPLVFLDEQLIAIYGYKIYLDKGHMK